MKINSERRRKQKNYWWTLKSKGIILYYKFEQKRRNKILIRFNNKNSLILKLIWDRINIIVFKNNNKDVVSAKEDIKYNKCKIT